MSAEVKAAGGSSTTNNPKKGAKGGRPPKGEAKAKQNAKEVKPKPSKPAKPSAPREPPKKLYRIVIRKLPPKDFTETDFLACLDRVCSQIEHTLQRSAFVFEHFIPGKISRKRGQVFSAGFLSVTEEAQYWKFLSVCPSIVPFLEGDETAQPEVSPAANQKAFKLKERNDRHINTYETDPFFAAFTAQLNKPVEKLTLADPLSDSKKAAAVQEDLIKNNPLLKYMREKAEKKVRDRRLAKKGLAGSAKELVVTSLLSRKISGGGGAGKAGKEGREGREGKEGKEKSSRHSGEKKEKERGSRGGKRESADGEKPESSKKSEGRRGGGSRSGGGGRKGELVDTTPGAPVGGDGGDAAATPMPKITIMKRSAGPAGASAGTEGGVSGGASGSVGGARGDRPPRGGKGSDREPRSGGGGGGGGNGAERGEGRDSSSRGAGGGAGGGLETSRSEGNVRGGRGGGAGGTGGRGGGNGGGGGRRGGGGGGQVAASAAPPG